MPCIRVHDVYDSFTKKVRTELRAIKNADTGKVTYWVSASNEAYTGKDVFIKKDHRTFYL